MATMIMIARALFNLHLSQLTLMRLWIRRFMVSLLGAFEQAAN